MFTRCKFKCVKIEGPSHSSAAIVTFETLYCPEVEEDIRYTEFTPWGAMEVAIDNPKVLSELRVGGKYYIDIFPADSQE